MSELYFVSHKQYYDLIFRAKNARLNSTAYVLDFMDWIKAGIAFNVRGTEDPSRRISYFVNLYRLLMSARENGISVLEESRDMLVEALRMYYEDIYLIYQYHLESKHLEAVNLITKKRPDFGELLVVPTFDCAPEMRELFETVVMGSSSYECQNIDSFVSNINSAYISHNSDLFRCMSMMYDYGCMSVGRGLLLEVKLWEEEIR